MGTVKMRWSLAFAALIWGFTGLALGQESKGGSAPTDANSSKANDSNIEGTTTQALMQGIFQPLSEVLPLAFDERAFEDPKNRGRIETLLKSLRDNAVAFSEHTAQKARGFEFVARSLESDARNLHRWYSRAYYNEARFVLQHMTENCIACHSSLPENHHFHGANNFLTKIDMSRLSSVERARLQVVSRQFDDALLSYEQALSDPKISPMNLVSLGLFADYLKLSLQVKHNPKRPQDLISKVMAKPDTPLHVQMQLQTWMKALKDLETTKVLERGSLSDAKRLMSEGQDLMQFPRDRDGLVHYIAAASLLTRFIDAHKDRGRNVAEAYYLLGISDSLLEHSFWITRAEFHLETAIRLAPGADFAPKAYALFESHMIDGYTGSSGTNVPADVRLLLKELQMLIQDAQERSHRKGGVKDKKDKRG